MCPGIAWAKKAPSQWLADVDCLFCLQRWAVSLLFFLTLFWRSRFSWVTCLLSSTLVCQFLLVAKFMEKSAARSVFLWYWSQSDWHFVCEFRPVFTWTKNIEKSSYYNWEVSSYCQKWVKEKVLCKYYVCLCYLNHRHWGDAWCSG